MVLIWFAVPPLLLYGHSLVSAAPIFGPPRYTLFVGPAYLILVARGLAKLPRMPRYAAVTAAVVLAWRSPANPGVRARRQGRLARCGNARPCGRSRATVVLLTDAPTNYGQFVPLRYYLGPEVKIMMMAQALEQLAADPQALGETAWTIVEFRDGKPKAVSSQGMARAVTLLPHWPGHFRPPS